MSTKLMESERYNFFHLQENRFIWFLKRTNRITALIEEAIDEWLPTGPCMELVGLKPVQSS